MPRIRYIGPFDSVTLAVNGLVVIQRQVVEVDDATHASLAEQTDWEDTTDPVSVVDGDGNVVVAAPKPSRPAVEPAAQPETENGVNQ